MHVSILNYPTTVEIPTTLAAINKWNESDYAFISGGTILQVNWEAGHDKPNHLISTEKLIELKGISEVERNGQYFLQIGAGMSLSDCLINPLVQKKAPLIVAACEKIAAPAIRNRGTIGGNICSKIGDCIPALLVLEAQLTFFNGKETYLVTLKDWLASQKSHSSELLTKVLIPIAAPKTETYSFFKKIGRRASFTAAIISIAGYLEFEEKNIRIIRIAIGGGSHIPTRLISTEREFTRSHSAIDWSRIFKVIQEDFSSYTDPFISEAYRKKVAANVIVANMKELLQ
ncbi:hypothetical protein CHH57_02605 [Niallia circulans]|uniref:FAD-binding PCMH-type domain-containing protein n=1 Tax=Niallia circulans TaxID=1397 RepID=A0AA91Z2V1_NIACI|nr:FAD binding domain-containing protein [Niallia circulans]PAD84849.1 hypothetical protein CHH57_02605 [Niallia circulans]